MDQLNTIVIITKNLECEQILERITLKCSKKVKAFSDELKALNFIRGTKIDMVIMSMLTSEEGTPVCELIRSVDKEVPILLINRNSSHEDYSLYFKGVDTLDAPLDAEILLRKIKLYKNLTEATKTLEKLSQCRRKTD